ncbi:unnamed protein product, partial [Allacma fusca]
FREVHRTF